MNGPYFFTTVSSYYCYLSYAFKKEGTSIVNFLDQKFIKFFEGQKSMFMIKTVSGNNLRRVIVHYF